MIVASLTIFFCISNPSLDLFLLLHQDNLSRSRQSNAKTIYGPFQRDEKDSAETCTIQTSHSTQIHLTITLSKPTTIVYRQRKLLSPTEIYFILCYLPTPELSYSPPNADTRSEDLLRFSRITWNSCATLPHRMHFYSIQPIQIPWPHRFGFCLPTDVPKRPLASALLLNTVFTDSCSFSTDEISVFSCGLSFCPIPRHINWPEISADIKTFSQCMRLAEY